MVLGYHADHGVVDFLVVHVVVRASVGEVRQVPVRHVVRHWDAYWDKRSKNSMNIIKIQQRNMYIRHGNADHLAIDESTSYFGQV